MNDDLVPQDKLPADDTVPLDKLPTDLRHKQLGITDPSEAPAASKFGVADIAGGIADVGRAAVTGTGANIAGGLMGAATLATNAVGLTHDDPVEQIRKWQKMAYPVESEAGKKIAGGISSAVSGAKKAVGLPDDVGKALGSHFENLGPMHATIAELMPDAFSTIMGFKGPEIFKNMAARGAGEIARDAMINKTKTNALKTAKTNGLFVPPGDDYMGWTSRHIAGASNRAEIDRELSVKNRNRVVELFKANQEVPDHVEVDRGTFTQLRAKWNQEYQAARSLPRMSLDAEFLQDSFNAGAEYDQLTADFSPEELVDLEKRIAQLRGTYMQPSWSADSAVNMMGHLRENAADLLRSDSHIDRKLGKVMRGMAEAFEDRLWRQASKEGTPEMAANFQNARRKLAQLHVWEDNADFDKGFFSARGIVAQRKGMQPRVDPFTDELKTVADVAGAYPATFQDIKFGPTPVSVFERYMIIGAASAKVAAGAGSGYAVAGREGAAVGTAIAASGIAGRAMLTSNWWQKRGLRPKSGEAGPVRQGLMELGPEEQAAGALLGAEGASPNE